MPYNIVQKILDNRWEEVVMSGARRVTGGGSSSPIAVLTMVGIGLLAAGGGPLNAQADSGSPGPLAQTCGVPPVASNAAGGGAASRGVPVFPAGQYPVKLPPASLL